MNKFKKTNKLSKKTFKCVLILFIILNISFFSVISYYLFASGSFNQKTSDGLLAGFQLGFLGDSTTVSETQSIQLYKEHDEDNSPIVLSHMLPGDSFAQVYNTRIYHNEDITLKFSLHDEVTDGLDEAISVTVIENSEKIIYHGTMKNMVDVTSSIVTPADGVSEISYLVVISVDTSVGNEWQNRQLETKFAWEVLETDRLTVPISWIQILLPIAFTTLFASGSGVFVFLFKRKIF